MSKPKMSKRLASLNFSEKIKILEKLRDRSLSLAVARVFLDSGPNDPTPDQERQRLQCDMQKYLSSHLKGGVPNSSRVALYAIARGWLEGHRGRVRFEFEVDGERRKKEITTVEELNTLIGPGQTPQTLLQALGASTSSS
jgi:hypothetical protein